MYLLYIGSTTALPLGINSSWYLQTTALRRFFYSPATDDQLWLAERKQVNPGLPTYQVSTFNVNKPKM